ncbi:FHA domain-containing protein [Streptomyces sp. CdTB01]|uniref:FHA domain-containing protein n=1 Tax=Streptomyces sp. CdTB01 TaxID=1725411 RepID=UPI00073AD6BF|nr:FHA domain-containing protein [Streptomyces sp. CdTB01]ALV35380.1 cell division protein FtsK [Streptomyces sp. CdTB01]
MQIRLTVVDPLGPPEKARGRAASRDVLVTAPAGTALATVASALASAVSGDAGAASGGGAVVLYAGAQRLDDQRCTLGEPPLIDGAVLSLGAPAEPEPHPELDDAPTQLHVVSGPDAGGVHLLHGGEIRIGRSADADVPLDDPDVSRLHCAVTVAADGRVSVADLGSTNGTTLDGTRLTTRPVRFTPGALLRVGESALRLSPAGGPGARMRTVADGEGCVRVPAGGEAGEAPPGTGPGAPAASASEARVTVPSAGAEGSMAVPHARAAEGEDPSTTRQAPGRASAEPPVVPGQGRAPRIEHRGDAAGDTHAGRSGALAWNATEPDTHAPAPDEAPSGARARSAADEESLVPGPGTGRRKGTPLRGTDIPPGVRRRGGLSSWARKLAGGRADQTATAPEAYSAPDSASPAAGPAPYAGSQLPETWPDPAALLLTALGPGPRLWERGPGHPEALTVRLGTADRPALDGSGLLPAVPVTANLREAGALGLAGPRERLAGLARAVLAQLAALHSPETLEIVLISADRSRSVEERTAEWSWLGWLPHLRPAHAQDCRLLLAYDREQATARTEELLRRLEDQQAETAHGTRTPTGTRTPVPGTATGGTAHPNGSTTPYPTDLENPSGARRADGPAGDERRAPARGALHRPSWARDDDGADGPEGFPGPYTVVVVDGDPGGADVREAVARLAVEGPDAGIHLVCLAETAPASPASPLTETYEAACAAAPVFRECGAVALLSGDVATALRLMRVARAATPPASATGTAETPRPAAGSSTSRGIPTAAAVPSDSPTPAASSAASGAHVPHTGLIAPGTVAVVDAVSPAWAERFARALAPLRPDGSGADRQPRVSVPLPQTARLLDELGLARATPASLMARWAAAADDPGSLGGRACAVLGAGPRGPVGADLAADGPHLLIEGPAGSGRTELLRAVVASLAAAERPDRLGIVLVDGRDGVGTTAGSHGEGLRVCTDVPHVTTHLTANDPVRMREFAQSLSAELKRRAELLGRSDFAEWHTGRELSGRMVSQRSTAARGTPASAPASGAAGAGDLDSPPSSTMRLRPAASRRQTEAAPPLPRLVVVVDDLDALVSPALGSPGRPAAGSVVRALEAVAREGERLGVHLVAAAGPGGRTAESGPARLATVRVTLEPPGSGPEEPSPGRGRLTAADGRTTPFQGGRVTGRIPRTATLRPTVVPLDWQRMGDPPARRPVRELGNGPTDLALLASALERAAREVSAAEVPSLL